LADSESKSFEKPITKKLKDESRDLKYWELNTGNIEVLREKSIDRVYFKIPEICQNLAKETRTNFVNTCKRDNPQQKVTELFAQSIIFRKEMEYYNELKDSKLWKFISPSWNMYI
jgi:hypothetical protein